MTTVPQARVVLDSVSAVGSRVTTIETTMHRFVQAEIKTHRMLSGSSASSRAIPVKKMIARVRDDPVWPVKWPAEQKGMQGGDALPQDVEGEVRAALEGLRLHTLDVAERCAALGLHKSVINRYLEPFGQITSIFTATDDRWGWPHGCRSHA
jgi:hypothetical protein